MSPLEDPVRDAVVRYFQRFPDAEIATHLDPVSKALFTHIERALVQADIAMQDEGLTLDQRRRVITSALYGSVDEEAAIRRHFEAREQYLRLRDAPS